MNKAFLMGFLGGDAVVHTGKNNKPFTTLSLATEESLKDAETGKYKSFTEWHNLIVSGDYAAKFKKGAFLFIEGKIEHTVYKGVKRDQIRVRFIRNLDRTKHAALEGQFDDDLPEGEDA